MSAARRWAGVPSFRAWAAVAAVLTALVYLESTFDRTLSAQHRLDLVVGMLFLQTYGLLVLAGLLARNLRDLRDQHKASTQVLTVRGLVAAARAATETGAMTPELRAALFGAMDEAFTEYDRHLEHRRRP